VCDCSDQAAHYHNLGPQLGASLLTRHIWLETEKRKVKNLEGADLNVDLVSRRLPEETEENQGPGNKMVDVCKA
jgi:hypothetical protein